MKPDFFIVFSLSRSGSSALFRALKSHSEISMVYEPQFGSANWNADEVLEMLTEIRSNFEGIKHHWDPSGWPFGGTHLSIIKDMEAQFEKIFELNKLLLTQPDQKVLFLRRRDELARLLSDQIGQQTDIWTPAHPAFLKAEITTVTNEAKTFREKVRSKAIRPIDMSIIQWYFDHVPDTENKFRASIPNHQCMDLYYEDLFNPEQDSAQRLKNYMRIIEFLGFSADQSFWNAEEIDALFDPKGKLNNSSTINKIPNINQIRERFS